MISSRRHFVKLGSVATAYGALGAVTFEAAEEPALGLILINPPIASDAQVLYPTGVRFLGKAIGLPGGMTREGYDEAIPRIVPAAQELAKQGAKVISVFGSSLTFYKGAKFHAELIEQVRNATGRLATSQSRPSRRPPFRQRPSHRRRHGLHRCRHRTVDGLFAGAWLRGHVGNGPWSLRIHHPRRRSYA